MLTAILLSNTAQLAMTPLGGYLADRYGFAKVMMSSVFGCMATATLWIFAVQSGSFALMVLGYMLRLSVFVSIGDGAQGALFANAFKKSATPECHWASKCRTFSAARSVRSAQRSSRGRPARCTRSPPISSRCWQSRP